MKNIKASESNIGLDSFCRRGIINFEDDVQGLYAVTLLAKESGIQVSSFKGSNYQNFTKRIAANFDINKKLIKFFNKYIKI